MNASPRPGHVVTFYSYKGGVGRSFLAANVACWLARVGFRVLCVDWDLEAPGLFHFFHERGLLERGPRQGLVDLLVAYQERQRPDWRRLRKAVALPDALGSLHLLDAGNGGGSDYASKLGRLDWEMSYASEDIQLGQRIEELRAEWIAEYDLVLIDSRTGLTDSGGVCLAQLPDVVVAVLAPSIQGLEGALAAVDTARSQRSLLPLGRGDFLTVPVMSRFDPQAAGESIEKWRRIAAERLWPLCEKWCEDKVRPEQLMTLLRVPYIARWSMGEPLPVLEEDTDDPATVSYAFASIAALCARRLAGSRAFVTDRNRYVREVREQNRRLLGRGDSELPPWRYDLFLSFTGAQRERARRLAGELQRRGRRVFLDERELQAGTAWPDGLAEGLRSARGMVALVGARPSSWQRAEVEAFLEIAGQATDRFVLPVWWETRPDWPELFARHGIEAARMSDAQIASRIHQELTRLDEREDAVEAEQESVSQAPTPIEWSPQEALDAYRDWLIGQHHRLVPYFAGASDFLLEDVCVETDIETRLDPFTEEGSKPHPGTGRHPGRREPGGTGQFEHFLLERREDGGGARWLVEGEPGAGKTTLARSLVHRWAQQGSRLAVFMPLARLGQARLDPVAFAVADMLGKDAAASPRARVLAKALDELRQSGDLVVLLDGFDEVEPGRLDPLFQELIQLCASQAFRAVPLVLLTRPIAVERRDVPTTFGRARILALRERQQDELLGKLLGDAEARAVRKHLHARPALAELARNPLLLTLLAVVARDTVLAESALPDTRSRLYLVAVDLLLRRGFGVEKKGVRDQGPARRVLQALSLRLHERGGETWERAVLSEVLTRLRRDSEELNFLVKETWGTNDGFLDDTGFNAGVLGPHDGPHAPWRYLHRSLREFLAAEELARLDAAKLTERIRAWAEEVQQHERRQREPGGSEAEEAPDPERWGEVYALLCGMVKDPFAVLGWIRDVSEDLARRALLSVEGLPLERGLEFALGLEWDPEYLGRLGAAWNVAGEMLHKLLWPRVTKQASVAELGGIWWLLEERGAPPDRQRFFAQCGRPVDRAPRLAAVEVPGGSFVMGSPENEHEREEDEGPQHPVSVASFWLARTVVTNRDYSAFDQDHRPQPRKGVSATELPEHPVVGVSWWEAYLYCRWIGARLPSEAEWEYACRAGTTTPFSFGDDITTQQVNYDGNHPYGGRKGEYRERTVAVGTLPPNAWGLREMHGNVMEWCQDRWHDTYEGAPADGSAWEQGGSAARVMRGGAWLVTARWCRSAYRHWGGPGFPYDSVGFRPASSSPAPFTTAPPDEAAEPEKSQQQPAPGKRRRIRRRI